MPAYSNSTTRPRTRDAPSANASARDVVRLRDDEPAFVDAQRRERRAERMRCRRLARSCRLASRAPQARHAAAKPKLRPRPRTRPRRIRARQAARATRPPPRARATSHLSPHCKIILTRHAVARPPTSSAPLSTRAAVVALALSAAAAAYTTRLRCPPPPLAAQPRRALPRRPAAAISTSDVPRVPATCWRRGAARALRSGRKEIVLAYSRRWWPRAAT